MMDNIYLKELRTHLCHAERDKVWCGDWSKDASSELILEDHWILIAAFTV
jgi:hypothetical protein